MARPREYNREEILAEFEKYVDETDIPIIAEFSYQHGMGRDTMYDWPEFSNLLKVCTAKKESALERGMLTQSVNVTGAIFSLKQLGWSDKIDQTHKGDAAHPLVFSESVRKL